MTDQVAAELTPAQKAFQWDPNLRHAPGSPDMKGNGFQSRCRCGYLGRWVTSSPSHAYQATRVHADTENRREAKGGAPMMVVPEQAETSGELAPETAPVAAPRASRPRPATGAQTPCGCGCGDPSGGLFRPGHDSKLLSRLAAEVKGGTKSVEDALAEMTEIGASDKLKAKFEGRVR